VGANFICAFIVRSRSSVDIFCKRELVAFCFSKKLGHPPRCVNIATTAMKKMQPRTTGTIQVGLRTIDSNVGLGANSTLKTRLNELSVVAGVGVAALAL
jgi:hypothetical protein